MRIAFLRALLTALLANAALSHAAPFAYVPNPDTNRVTVVDLATDKVVASVPVGSRPIGIAIDATDSRVYVANSAGNSISVIDTFDNTVTATIGLAAGPFGLAYNATIDRVVASLPTLDSIVAIDPATNGVVQTARVGQAPLGVVFDNPGTRLYVANSGSGTVSVLDGSSLAAVAAIPVDPGPFALEFIFPRLYVTHGGTPSATGHTVKVVDAGTNAVTATLAVGSNPTAVAPGNFSEVFIANADSNSVTIFGSDDVVRSTIPVSGRPASIALHTDGSRVYVIGTTDGVMSSYDSRTYEKRGSVNVGAGSLAMGRFITGTSSHGANAPGAVSGLWWNPAESGWGVHFVHRGANMFVSWYTYDASGNPKWYVASNCAVSGHSCSGTVYEVSGPRFFGAPFDSLTARVASAGTLTIAFSSTDRATMSYTVNGVSRVVPLQRQLFVSFGRPGAGTYTDIWWAPSEPGWGMAITEEGGILFFAWYVYDDAGKPVWYVAPNCTLVSRAGNLCGSPIYRTTAAPFGPSFDARQVQVFEVGNISVHTLGNDSMEFSYTVNGVSGSKTIVRQLF